MTSTDQEEEEDVLALLPNAPSFCRAKHVDYIASLSAKMEKSFEGALTQHLKLSGIYWSLTAMSLLEENYAEKMQLHEKIVPYVAECFDINTGGYGGHAGHTGHLLYTLSAIQILALAGQLDLVPLSEVVGFVKGLQQGDGSFIGSPTDNEVDTRFSYCAVSALSILNQLETSLSEKAADYIDNCRNLDGGYGSCVGAESHAGQVFCCVAALSICKRLPSQKESTLAWWLSERQCDSGGLNGRSEKQADVCYSWWILSSMSILNIVEYIDTTKLALFILKAQDLQDGGIADRPDDMADVFHTFFGIAGLDLLGHVVGSRRIDPVYALPVSLVQELKLKAHVLQGGDGEVDARLQHYLDGDV